jgi:diguanylate cyclase (GGDEF)-like protein
MRGIASLVEYRPAGAARLAVWLAVLLACGLGFAANYFTSPQLDYGAVFLVPCIAASWYLGSAAGLATVALSAAAWFTVMLLQGPAAEPWVILTNTVSRFSLFLVVAALVASVRRLMQRLAELSRLDALTGLANRREFHARCEHDLAVASRSGSPTSLVFIDLDHFKDVNDRLGHAAGDEVLRMVASALSAAARRSDLAARLGGDEFALLLLGSDAQAARRIADKARAALHAAFSARELPVTLSVGIACSPESGARCDELLAAADRAMYAAKAAGKDAVVVSDDLGLGARPAWSA